METKCAWYFAETSKVIAAESTVVCIPSSVTSKKELFDAYEVSLGLPDYFGTNWDAFEECIRNLSWVTTRKIILSHDGIPFAGSPELLITYLSILAGAVEKWAEQAEHDVEIHFPKEAESIIKRILEKKAYELTAQHFHCSLPDRLSGRGSFFHKV